MQKPTTALFDALIVDDDIAFRAFLEESFVQAGFRVRTATTGKEALALARELKPAAMILDFGLPDITGLDVVKKLKNDAEMSGTLILVLTGNDARGREVTCLDDGADAYLVKGECPIQAVVAHTRALLRIKGTPLARRLKVGPVAIDLNERKTLVGGKPTKKLTVKEFELLALLMSESSKIVGWEALGLIVPDLPSIPPQKAQDSARVHLCHLKKKLGPKGAACLVTHKLIGLQFLPPSAKTCKKGSNGSPPQGQKS